MSIGSGGVQALVGKEEGMFRKVLFESLVLRFQFHFVSGRSRRRTDIKFFISSLRFLHNSFWSSIFLTSVSKERGSHLRSSHFVVTYLEFRHTVQNKVRILHFTTLGRASSLASIVRTLVLY